MPIHESELLHCWLARTFEVALKATRLNSTTQWNQVCARPGSRASNLRSKRDSVSDKRKYNYRPDERDKHSRRSRALCCVRGDRNAGLCRGGHAGHIHRRQAMVDENRRTSDGAEQASQPANTLLLSPIKTVSEQARNGSHSAGSFGSSAIGPSRWQLRGGPRRPVTNCDVAGAGQRYPRASSRCNARFFVVMGMQVGVN